MPELVVSTAQMTCTCIPVIAAPWTPGSAKVTVGGTPALTSDSRCTCSWGGSISVTSAGQTTVTG